MYYVCLLRNYPQEYMATLDPASALAARGPPVSLAPALSTGMWFFSLSS